jgi:zinc protease
MSQTVTAQKQQIIHRTVLNNGIVVIAVENSAADIISSRIFIRAGSQRESTKKNQDLLTSYQTVITKGTARSVIDGNC